MKSTGKKIKPSLGKTGRPGTKFKVTRKRITLSKKEIESFTSSAKGMIEYLEREGILSEKTISNYKSELRRILVVMINNDIKEFNSTTAGRLRKFMSVSHVTCASLNHLDEFLTTGKVKPGTLWKHDAPKYEYPGAIGSLILEFIANCRTEKLSHGRVRHFEIHLHKFNEFCIENQITEFKFANIRQFLDGREFHQMPHPEYAIECLILLTRYLFLSEKIPHDFSHKIPRVRKINLSRIPSVYTEDELRKVINSLDRNSPIGKRNFAIVLIGMLLGFRATDIANLQFRHFDWGNEQISFSQFKTKKPISSKLLSWISDAVVDYVEHGRRESSEPYIFLLDRPPFSKITRSTVEHVMARAFQNSGVERNQRTQGVRALRSTVATDATKSGAGIHDVKDILGHVDLDVVQYYVLYDPETIRLCCQDVPPIDDKFYLENGFVL